METTCVCSLQSHENASEMITDEIICEAVGSGPGDPRSLPALPLRVSPCLHSTILGSCSWGTKNVNNWASQKEKVYRNTLFLLSFTDFALFINWRQESLPAKWLRLSLWWSSGTEPEVFPRYACTAWQKAHTSFSLVRSKRSSLYSDLIHSTLPSCHCAWYCQPPHLSLPVTQNRSGLVLMQIHFTVCRGVLFFQDLLWSFNLKW